MYILKSLPLLNSAIIVPLVGLRVIRLLGLLWNILSTQSVFLRFSLGSIGSLTLELVVLLDALRLSFLMSVSLIAASVVSFAKSYISSEVFFARFILLVLRFVGSIFLLILSPNLMRVLLGWDGLGVTSYLLVIYYHSNKSYNAGIITALTNRIGDVAILIIIAFLLTFGSWNYSVIASEAPLSLIDPVTAGVVLAAITKSAQIPFSAWLPAAMAAPTPVSALVHSSTLVTAGVYLLIRFNLFLAQSSARTLILFFGSITILIAGIRAIFEMDIKKMVALSTLSQLGLIVSALGIGRPDIAFFHLLTHAYFKALLFICAGNLIHCRNDYQDLRQIGRIALNLPVTTRFVTLRNFSLCGLPFMAGFYSKDIFLEARLLSPLASSSVLIFFLATLLTAAYSLRFVLITALRFSSARALLWSRDEDRVITRGIWILILPAVMGGRFLNWGLFPSPNLVYLPLALKIGALIVTVIGVAVAIRVRLRELLPSSSFLRWTCGSMWMLALISARRWNQAGLSVSWRLRSLRDSSFFSVLYHSGPESISSSSASSLEGLALSSFIRILQITAIWSLVVLTLILLIYSRTWLRFP